MEGVFQHSTSRKRWRVRKSFFFIPAAAAAGAEEEEDCDGGEASELPSFFTEEYSAHGEPTSFSRMPPAENNGMEDDVLVLTG